MIYGFGNSADGSRGFAVSANYRRTEKEPVLNTLALPQTTFKDSSLLVARLTGGSDVHMPGHLGRAVTQFERRVETAAELAAELKAGRFFGRYLLGP